MQIPALLDQLAADGRLLLDAALRAGWDARVPGCDWDVRELVTHTGGIHRWATDIVATSGQAFDTPAGAAVGSGPADDELGEWFASGHTALVETLRAAPPDLDCATFLPADSPLHFWCRRQAHETAIHRVDAEGASGATITPFEASFAQDGMGEILRGFARRKRKPADRTATLGLAATDGPAWLLTVGGERVEAAESSDIDAADATVRGSSADLYRWLWNRPADVAIDGDGSVLGLWSDAVQVRWS